jgi:hypothetical protein
MITSTAKRASTSGKFPTTPSAPIDSEIGGSSSTDAAEHPYRTTSHKDTNKDSAYNGHNRVHDGGLDVNYDAKYDNSKGDRLYNRRLALFGVFVLIVLVMSIFVLSLTPTTSPTHHRRHTDNDNGSGNILAKTDPQSNAAWVEPARADIHTHLKNQQRHQQQQGQQSRSKDTASATDISQRIKAVGIKLDDDEEAEEEGEGQHGESSKDADSIQRALGNPDAQGCVHSIPASHFDGKHITEPPEGPVTLVCCQTTKGVLNVAVHHNWAPNGADR